jgi:hypothetical protein
MHTNDTTSWRQFERYPAAYAASLTIESEASPHKRGRTFDALDCFFEADHAIAYATNVFGSR